MCRGLQAHSALESVASQRCEERGSGRVGGRPRRPEMRPGPSLGPSLAARRSKRSVQQLYLACAPCATRPRARPREARSHLLLLGRSCRLARLSPPLSSLFSCFSATTVTMASFCPTMLERYVRPPSACLPRRPPPDPDPVPQADDVRISTEHPFLAAAGESDLSQQVIEWAAGRGEGDLTSSSPPPPAQASTSSRATS